MYLLLHPFLVPVRSMLFDASQKLATASFCQHSSALPATCSDPLQLSSILPFCSFAQVTKPSIVLGHAASKSCVVKSGSMSRVKSRKRDQVSLDTVRDLTSSVR